MPTLGTSASVDSIKLKHTTKPSSAPPVGFLDVYVKADDSVYTYNSGSVEKQTGGNVIGGWNSVCTLSTNHQIVATDTSTLHFVPATSSANVVLTLPVPADVSVGDAFFILAGSHDGTYYTVVQVGDTASEYIMTHLEDTVGSCSAIRGPTSALRNWPYMEVRYYGSGSWFETDFNGSWGDL